MNLHFKCASLPQSSDVKFDTFIIINFLCASMRIFHVRKFSGKIKLSALTNVGRQFSINTRRSIYLRSVIQKKNALFKAECFAKFLLESASERTKYFFQRSPPDDRAQKESLDVLGNGISFAIPLWILLVHFSRSNLKDEMRKFSFIESPNKLYSNKHIHAH